MKTLLTGGSGFIGNGLIPVLSAQGHELVLAVRSELARYPDIQQASVPDLNKDTNWSAALHGCDCVIHAAAHAGTSALSKQADIDRLYAVNTHATLALAEQASHAGVKRFIFLSSIKVNGETSRPDEPFSITSVPAPSGHYGQSKFQAEQGLEKIAQATGLEVVIVRPPLVYGPGVSANFAILMKLVAKKLPLPFGSAMNRRGFIARDNLVDFIVRCLDHPNAKNQKFIVSDDNDMTMAEWFKAIALSLDTRARLIPFPPMILVACCKLIGKTSLANSVLGSLELDISHSKRLLEWEPPVSVVQALKQTAQNFQGSSSP